MYLCHRFTAGPDNKKILLRTNHEFKMTTDSKDLSSPCTNPRRVIKPQASTIKRIDNIWDIKLPYLVCIYRL